MKVGRWNDADSLEWQKSKKFLISHQSSQLLFIDNVGLEQMKL